MNLNDFLKFKNFENGSGGVSSWNDLTDKPFGDLPTGGDTLYFDGNRDGLEFVTWQYKISDVVVTPEDLVNGYSTVNSFRDRKTDYTYDDLQKYDGYYSRGNLAFVFDASKTEYPSNGIWHCDWAEEYYKQIIIPNFTGFPSKKPIDPSYLPEIGKAYHISRFEGKFMDGFFITKDDVIKMTNDWIAGNARIIIFGNNYTLNTDIWSLGVCVYYMIFGNCPIEEKDKNVYKEKLLKDTFNFIEKIFFNYQQKINSN